MPIDIPEELVTKVYTMGGLRQMALAWNTFDTEFLKRYFKDGGTPYLAYDKELLYSLSKIYRSMPSGHIGSAFNDRFIVPLPSLTVHLHFFNEDGTRNLKKLDGYNEMLDMCLEHGLSINACDSVGLTMLNSSLAYFSIFSKLLPEEDCGPSSFIGYSEELFDCTVAGILLGRGADPFCLPGKPYLSSNVLMQAAEGTYSTNNRMDTVRETMQANDAQKCFYTDFLGHICRSAPSFSESPYHVFDQRESIKKLIQSGLDKVFYYGAISESENRDEEYAERILSSLDLILEKNVVTEAALRSDSSKGYYQDSVLCRLCEDLRDNLETTALWLPHANTASGSNHLETGVYYAAMDYLKRLLILLRHYGADINLPEESGMLPVSGLLRPTWRRSIKSSSIYKYMKDAEAVLVQCGWDPTVKDDEGKTLFDRYRNKREGQKAFKASMKIVEQIKAEESAYSSIDEEFVR